MGEKREGNAARAAGEGPPAPSIIQQGARAAPERPRPVVLDAAEREWAEAVPPDLLPHFRCVRHGRGSVIRRARPERP